MPTTHTCYAAIDIGSNAVRLLIKKVKEDETVLNKRLSKVLLLRVPLRPCGMPVMGNPLSRRY